MVTSAGILMVTALLPAVIVTGPGVAMGGSGVSNVPENGICELGEFCEFSQDNFQGQVYDWAACEDARRYRGLTFINSTRRLDDNVESIRNLSGYVYAIYDVSRYRGESMEIFSGAPSVSDVDDLGLLEEEVSSHQCIGS
jgi:hypothetical protein